jgi:hypothetical protein
MEDVEAQVLELVRRAAGRRKSRVTLASALCGDLGICGEDAGELVEAVAARFGVDVRRLYTHWDRHFPPEHSDGPPLAGIMTVPPVLAVFVVTERWASRAAAWIAGAIVALGALWVCDRLWKRYLGRRADWYLEISVQDLVNLVRAGRWEREYDY